MPTAEATDNEDLKPRFKVDHAASPMPEINKPERLAPRATSNRNGGRNHLGILGEIKSEYPGEIIGIGKLAAPVPPGGRWATGFPHYLARSERRWKCRHLCMRGALRAKSCTRW